MSESTRPWFRRLRIAAVGLLVLLVAVVGLLQLSPVATWAVRRLVQVVPLSPGYRIEVGRVGGDWFGSLVLEDLALLHGQRELIHVRRLTAYYSISDLMATPPRIRAIDIAGVRATARREDGNWDLTGALRPSAGTGSSGGFIVGTIAIDDASLIAELSPDSLLRVRGLGALVRELKTGDPATASIDRLNLSVSPPRSSRWLEVATQGKVSDRFFTLDPFRVQSERSHVSGRVVLPRRLHDRQALAGFELRLRAAPLEFADIAPLVPSAPSTGALRLDASAGARGDTVIAHLDARTVGGPIAGATLAFGGWITPLDSVPSYRFDGSAEGLPVGAGLARMLTGISADSVFAARFSMRGNGIVRSEAHLGGRIDVAAQRGGTRHPVGHATLDFDRGHLVARPEFILAGGRISAVASAMLGDTVTYRVTRGTFAGVDLGRLMGDTVTTPLNGRFTLSGTGTSPNTARVVADVRLDQLRYGTRHVDSIVAGMRLHEGRADLTVHGVLQGGRVAADVIAFPFNSTGLFDLTSARLDSVDLGALMDQPALAGPVTLSARAAGQWSSGVRKVKGQLELEPSRLGHVSIVSGTLRAGINGHLLTYEAAVTTRGGALAFTGDGYPLAKTPVYTVRRGRADSLDLGVLLDRAGMKSDINATFAAVAGAGSDSVNVSLLPSTVNDAEIASGRLALVKRTDRVDGAITLEGGDGRLHARANGRISHDVTLLHTEGMLAVEHLRKWTARPGGDGRVEAEFAFDVTSDSAGLRSVGGRVNAIGGVGEVRVLGARLALTPVDGAVQVDSFELRSNVGHLSGLGTIALRDGAAPGVFKLAGRFANVEPLAALAGPDTVSIDSAGVALELRGPARHWQFRGNGDAHSVMFAGNFAERIGLTASGTIDSTGLSGVQGALEARNGAYGKVMIPQLNISARYDSLVGLDASVAIGDSIRLATSLRGTVEGDTIRAVVRRLDLTEPSRSWALERPVNVELGRRTRIDGLSLISGSHRISLSGIFDLRDSSDVTLGIRGLDLAGFRSAGLVPVGGRLDGEMHLLGRADDPTLQGKVGVVIGASEGPAQGRIDAEMLWKREGLRFSAVAAATEGGQLTVGGTLPYRFTLAPADTSARVGVERGTVDTLGITFRADSFNLSLFRPLLPPDVAVDLAGALAAAGHITGRLDAPVATGTLSLSDAGVTLPGLGVTYSRGELTGRLDGEELRIERLRLMTGKKQELDARGVIHLKPLNDPGLELDARLTDFLVSNSPTLRTSASGNVRLIGSVQAPSLTGALTVGPTDVFVGAEAAAARVEEVELTPEDLRGLARDFGPSVLTRGQEKAGLLDRLTMDLELRLPRRVWLRRRKNPEANIELSGAMRLTQQPGGEMQFAGTVRPVPGRGSLDLSGRTFRLTGGDIDLSGPVDSTRLDVTAEYQVPTQGGGEDAGVVITVEAKGRLDSLGLEFTSEPSMSKEDVLSYLVTGHPASDNPLESGGPGVSGKQMVYGQLSQALSTTAGKQLGFDVFQIKTDAASGLSLTAGRYLSSRFFLNLKLPLGRGSSTLPGDNLGPGFELEYSANRWLRADLRGGSLEPAMLFRGRYAY
ncbi:MAG: translocation/assembly module TamB domain-containing protein [Gemmatimonadales bacterium]